MGREIRRVPAGWEHPRQDCPHSPWAGGCKSAKENGGRCYKPLYDRTFQSAFQEWQTDLEKWIAGERPAYFTTDLYEGMEPAESFTEYHGRSPDPEYYRPVFTEASHFQVYETVSEGTPTSPVFASLGGVEDWLVEQGYERKAAHQFCALGSGPSFVMLGSRLYDSVESAALIHPAADSV